MARLTNAARKLLADDRGGEVLEYVLIAGLIILGCIVVVRAFGLKVLARWNTVNAAAL